MKVSQLLFDADILRYRCGFAADSQAKKQFGEDKYLEREYVEWALGNVKTTIEDTLNRFNATKENCKFYLTGPGNFRDEIATIKKYKGNRDTSHKPKYYVEIKEYLIGAWKAEVCEGYEADDALGVAQWANPDRSTCIVTVDKDLDMIPGWHYNWVKGVLRDISLKEANYHFYWQMLVGDTTDNIPGIRGVGPKTASKLLNTEGTEEDWHQLVSHQYMAQYGNEWVSAANEVAALLWMWRKPNDSPPFFAL